MGYLKGYLKGDLKGYLKGYLSGYLKDYLRGYLKGYVIERRHAIIEGAEKPRVALQGARGRRRRLRSVTLWLRAKPNSLPRAFRYQAACVCKARVLAASNSIGFAQPSVRWGDLLNLRVRG